MEASLAVVTKERDLLQTTHARTSYSVMDLRCKVLQRERDSLSADVHELRKMVGTSHPVIGRHALADPYEDGQRELEAYHMNLERERALIHQSLRK